MKKQKSLAVETLLALVSIPFWIAGAIGKTAIDGLLGADGLLGLGPPPPQSPQPQTRAPYPSVKREETKTAIYVRPDKKLKPLRTDITLKEKGGWGSVAYTTTWVNI